MDRVLRASAGDFASLCTRTHADRETHGPEQGARVLGALLCFAALTDMSPSFWVACMKPMRVESIGHFVDQHLKFDFELL